MTVQQSASFSAAQVSDFGDFLRVLTVGLAVEFDVERVERGPGPVSRTEREEGGGCAPARLISVPPAAFFS